jgi:hypothetical protein
LGGVNLHLLRKQECRWAAALVVVTARLLRGLALAFVRVMMAALDGLGRIDCERTSAVQVPMRVVPAASKHRLDGENGDHQTGNCCVHIGAKIPHNILALIGSWVKRDCGKYGKTVISSRP